MIRTNWNFEGLVVAYRVCCLAVLTWTGSCKDNMRRNQRIQNVSQTIEDLLNGYDIRLRPQFGGDLANLYLDYSCCLKIIQG